PAAVRLRRRSDRPAVPREPRAVRSLGRADRRGGMSLDPRPVLSDRPAGEGFVPRAGPRRRPVRDRGGGLAREDPPARDGPPVRDAVHRSVGRGGQTRGPGGASPDRARALGAEEPPPRRGRLTAAVRRTGPRSYPRRS